jgi:hypothetical protein
MLNLTAAQPLRRATAIARPLPRALVTPIEPAQPTIFQFMRQMTLSQWMLVLYPVILMVLARRRDETDVAVVDGSAVAQIALTALYGTWVLGRLVQSLKSIEKIVVGTGLRWLLMYSVLAVMSAAWSTMPALTAYRSVQIVVFLLLTADAMSSAKNAQDMLRLQLLYAAAEVICWQFAPVIQSLSLEAIHSSDVPGTIVAILFIGWMVRGKQWRTLYIGLALAAAAATSAGTFLALVGGLIVSLLFMRGRASGSGLILLFGMLVTFTCFHDQVNQLLFYGKTKSTIESGSGRIPIWTWILTERVPQAPIFGFGFGAGEVQARLYNVGGFRMMHMHNAAMSAIVNLGAAGEALFALFIMAMFSKALRQRDQKIRIVLLGALTALMLNTLTMESVTAPLSPPWIGHAMFYATIVLALWNEQSVTPSPTQPLRQLTPQRIRTTGIRGRI